ncbi:hypothetical protein BDR04DRAFT_1115451 [Suillus decipiens]|nr:hypothetical protein BDR04DRAFT_1115451 [Suillus decipiens]
MVQWCSKQFLIQKVWLAGLSTHWYKIQAGHRRLPLIAVGSHEHHDFQQTLQQQLDADDSNFNNLVSVINQSHAQLGFLPSEHDGDPATKDFIPKFKDHILYRLKKLDMRNATVIIPNIMVYSVQMMKIHGLKGLVVTPKNTHPKEEQDDWEEFYVRMTSSGFVENCQRMFWFPVSSYGH